MARILQSVSSKVGFVFVILSIICWIVYIIGFALEYERWSGEVPANNTVLSLPYLPHWLYAVSPALLYLFLLLQLLFGGGLALALPVVSLVPPVLLSQGALLQFNVLLYYRAYLLSESVTIEDYLHVQTGGALSALVTMWVGLALWTCSLVSRKHFQYHQIN